MKKQLLFFTFSVLTLGTVVGANFFNKPMVDKVNADVEYTLTYDATHVVTSDKIYTADGNTIWTKANDNCSFTSNGLEFNKFGYIQNLSALQGIKSLDIKVTSGSYYVSYGYVEPSDLRTPMYHHSTISEDTVVSFESINYPSRFRIQALTAGTIESIEVTYSCTASEGDVGSETVSDGLENVKLEKSNKNAVVSYTTDEDELCQREYAESKRALKITDTAKNESINIINVAQALSDKAIIEEEDVYLILDIKSNDTRVGARVNPFMFSANVTDSAAWKSGWQDPDGYFNLADHPGWSRYYWKVDSNDQATNQNTVIPKEYLTGVNFIVTSEQNADTYYILDNIHFGTKPTMEHDANTDKAFANEDKFVIGPNSIFTFDFKVTDEVDETKILKFYFKSNHKIDFELNADGSRVGGGEYSGSYYTQLKNGWVRYWIDIGEYNRIDLTWQKWDFANYNNEINEYGWRQGNTYNAIITTPRLIDNTLEHFARPGENYANFCDIDLSTVTSAYMDYKIIGNKDSKTYFKFFDGSDWDKSYGYFCFNYNGTCYNRSSYDGVTITPQGYGVYRLTFNFAQITVLGDNGAPTTIKNLYCWDRWANAVMTVSDLVVIE